MIAACGQLQNWQMRWPCSVPIQEVTSLKLLVNIVVIGNHGYINQPVVQQYISTCPCHSLISRPPLHATSFFAALQLPHSQIFKSGKLTNNNLGKPGNEASHVIRIIKCWPHCPGEIVHQSSSTILVTNLSVSSLSLFLSS